MLALRIVLTLTGVLVLLAVLLDALETVVLPRRVRGLFRLTAWYYRLTWGPWAGMTRRLKSQARRESLLGYYGPLSLIFLLALWAAGLIFGFALVQYGTGAHLLLANGHLSFGLLLYHSGETFFTLGYGDIVPDSGWSRFLAVLEAGMGFAFLGIVIGYLPTIYSAFSRREIEISLLDARAGSPPTAAELLRRYCQCPPHDGLDRIFHAWERWSAEVLESHLSYPVLSFFRSQHNNQSWLAALTTILDATTLVIVGLDGIPSEQARMTFAMARHAVVDLAQVANAKYDPLFPDRLPGEELSRLRKALSDRNLRLREGTEAEEKLAALRAMYEPYVSALARSLLIVLPPWLYPEKREDNWQVAPWDEAIAARSTKSVSAYHSEDHF
ncbi:MAG TPA: potassium channel family protein [Polyangia bacterium]